MSDSSLTPTPAALRHRRELTIARLCEHFANDHLEAEELEELIDRAHRADTLAALDHLLAGLPALTPAPTPVAPLQQPPTGAEHQVVIAVMGGADRKGAWAPARNLYVTAVMGGAVLDFRQARIEPGITNLYVLAIMGGVEIVIPPGLRVESNGIGIMGGFEHAGDRGSAGGEAGPVLRISGAAIMGGVEIKERPVKQLPPGSKP
ncbi:MAG TPA: hypothetical protein VFZ18_13010 [Longimicrobiaceae bacterium]